MKKGLLFALAFIFISVITKANNYQVTTASDTGAGSLRAMIDSADLHAGLDTITLNLTSHDTIHLGNPLANIYDSLMITGLPCQNPTITGDSITFSVSAFNVTDTTMPLILNYLNISNCNIHPVSIPGGAAVSAGPMYINNCYFFGNSCTAGLTTIGYGGAINAVHIWAYNSTFNNNTCIQGPGAFSAVGGALFAADINLFNCTFINNYATIKGGAIGGTVSQIQNCTFADNSARAGGGAIYSAGLGSVVSNCIIWGNFVTDSPALFPAGIECTGFDTSAGCNILQDTLATDSFTKVPSDIVGVNPQFGTLGYYSGCVPVLPILCGSVAQNHAACTGATVTDAQGIAAQGVRDAGAFEITSPHLYSDSLDSIQPGTTADLYNYFNTTGLSIQWSNGLNDSTATVVDTGTYTVIGTNFLGCSDTATVTIIYARDTTTAIKNVSDDWDIQLFPNPAKNQVIVKWNTKTSGMVLLKVNDMLGQVVLEQNADGPTGKVVMNIASVSGGTYYVSLKGDSENVYVGKLIILDR